RRPEVLRIEEPACLSWRRWLRQSEHTVDAPVADSEVPLGALPAERGPPGRFRLSRQPGVHERPGRVELWRAAAGGDRASERDVSEQAQRCIYPRFRVVAGLRRSVRRQLDSAAPPALLEAGAHVRSNLFTREECA